MKNGHLSKCKECCKKQAKQRRIDKYDEITFYDRNRPNKKERTKKLKEYYQRMKVDNPEKYDEIVRESKRRWSRNNKDKRIAEWKVGQAVKDKKLVKPILCERCRRELPLEGHHFDYTRPLDVIWLCSECHHKIHVEQRNAERMLAN